MKEKKKRKIEKERNKKDTHTRATTIYCTSSTSRPSYVLKTDESE
jgi:hypothetical protein